MTRARATLVALAAVVLAGCAPAPPLTPPKTPSPTPTLAPATATAGVNVVGRDGLAAGGALRLAVGALPDTWNPWTAGGDGADAQAVRAPLTPRLFVADAAGRLTADPAWLAAEPVTTTTPAFTVELRLNPLATWNDGTPLRVVDFLATWKACNGSSPAFRCARTDGFRRITGIREGGDGRTVVITFAAAYPDWRHLFLHGPARAESVATPAVFNDGWATLAGHEGWFSGPFTVGSYDTLAQQVTLVRNPRWWGDRPALDAVSFRVVPRPVDAYLAGTLDAVDLGLDVRAYRQALQVSDGVLHRAPGLERRILTIGDSGPLDDRTVRVAVLRAIDPARVGAVDLAGLDWSPTRLGSLLLLAQQEGYEDRSDLLATDASAAATALEEAGWRLGGDGIRRRDGSPLALRVAVVTGDTTSQNEGYQLVAQLRAVGVTVTRVPAQPADVIRLLETGSVDLVTSTMSGGLFPYETALRLLASAGVEAPANLSTATDPDVRTAAARLVESQAWAAARLLPLYQVPDLVAARATVANYGAFGLSSPVWEDVGFTK